MPATKVLSLLTDNLAREIQYYTAHWEIYRMNVARYILFFVLLLSTTIPIISSDCDCEGFKKTEVLFVQHVHSGNRKAMQEIYDKVKAQPSPLCSIYAKNLQAQIVLFDGNVDSAKALLAEERRLLLESSCEKKTLIYNERQLAYIAFLSEDKEGALKHLFNVADICEQNKDTLQQVTALLNVASIVGIIGDFERQIEILDKVSRLIDKSHNSGDKGNVSAAYVDAYRTAFNKTQKESYKQKFIEWAIKNLEYNRADERITNWVRAYQSRALAEMYRGSFQNALLYADSSLKISNGKLPPFVLINTYVILANSYSGLGNHNAAKQFADSALASAQQSGVPRTIITAYETMQEVLEHAGNYKEAYQVLKAKVGLSDSINTVETFEKARALELQYNKVKDEKTISELEKQKEISSLNIKLLGVVLISFVLVAVVLIVLYRQKALKDKQHIMETEQRLQRARINPHFFFNSLGSLQSFALTENDSFRVSSYLGKYARMMRQTLESSYNELVTVDEEIDFLRNYIELESLRQPNKFDFEITTDENVEVEEMRIPSMILQPFIENSIEHGFKSIAYKGLIAIHFSIEGDSVHICIVDNGSKNSSSKHQDYPSRAMQITRDRLYLLNRQYQSHAVFTLKDNDTQGKTVDISLPILYETAKQV